MPRPQTPTQRVPDLPAGVIFPQSVPRNRVLARVFPRVHLHTPGGAVPRCWSACRACTTAPPCAPPSAGARAAAPCCSPSCSRERFVVAGGAMAGPTAGSGELTIAGGLLRRRHPGAPAGGRSPTSTTAKAGRAGDRGLRHRHRRPAAAPRHPRTGRRRRHLHRRHIPAPRHGEWGSPRGVVVPASPRARFPVTVDATGAVGWGWRPRPTRPGHRRRRRGRTCFTWVAVGRGRRPRGGRRRAGGPAGAGRAARRPRAGGGLPAS